MENPGLILSISCIIWSFEKFWYFRRPPLNSYSLVKTGCVNNPFILAWSLLSLAPSLESCLLLRPSFSPSCEDKAEGSPAWHSPPRQAHLHDRRLSLHRGSLCRERSAHWWVSSALTELPDIPPGSKWVGSLAAGLVGACRLGNREDSPSRAPFTLSGLCLLERPEFLSTMWYSLFFFNVYTIVLNIRLKILFSDYPPESSTSD